MSKRILLTICTALLLITGCAPETIQLATAESEEYTCQMIFTKPIPPDPSNLRVYASLKSEADHRRPLTQYNSVDQQGYIRFHEPDVVEFGQGNRSDEFAELGVMLVNLSTWEGDEIVYSDAAEYDSVNNGYFLKPVIAGDRVALVVVVSQERHRFYRIKVWEPSTQEWHETLILGAKDVAVSFESDEYLALDVDWGKGRLHAYRLDLRQNQYSIK